MCFLILYGLWYYLLSTCFVFVCFVCVGFVRLSIWLCLIEFFGEILVYIGIKIEHDWYVYRTCWEFCVCKVLSNNWCCFFCVCVFSVNERVSFFGMYTLFCIFNTFCVYIFYVGVIGKNTLFNSIYFIIRSIIIIKKMDWIKNVLCECVFLCTYRLFLDICSWEARSRSVCCWVFDIIVSLIDIFVGFGFGLLMLMVYIVC